MQVLLNRLFRGVLPCSAILLAGCNLPGKETPVAGLEKVPTAGQAISVPVNQTLTPAGIQIDLPAMRPQVLALSPDGKLLATSGRHEVIVINPGDGKILQNVKLPADKLRSTDTNTVSEQILHPDTDAQASYTGLIFSPDGRRIYLSNVRGDIKVLAVNSEGKVTPLHSLPLPQTKNADRKSEVPAGLAISPDGQRLYIAGNLSNRLLELDTATGKTLRTIEVGSVPYDVVLAGEKVYVSNWGGRRPGPGSTIGPAGHGTTVTVDPVRHIANEGSVSIVNLRSGQVEKELVVGMHACGMAVSPDKGTVAVASSGSDTIAVIDTARDAVVETISLRWQPKDLYGASPNALAFDQAGKTLYVCNGTQNAIGVVRFQPGKSALAGLVPTGWYPGSNRTGFEA